MEEACRSENSTTVAVAVRITNTLDVPDLEIPGLPGSSSTLNKSPLKHPHSFTMLVVVRDEAESRPVALLVNPNTDHLGAQRLGG